MSISSWSPQSFGIPSRQNRTLWKDMERAYEFVETNSPYVISGDIEGFLFNLIRRRWNLACNALFEPLPTALEMGQSAGRDIIPSAPAGLTLGGLENLSLSRNFVENFKQYAHDQPSEMVTNQGVLYGYGTDGYATYIPLHLLWPDLKAYWGVYVSEMGILQLAVIIYRDMLRRQLVVDADYEKSAIQSVIQIAYQALLRHQLFHFKIEQWALLLELVTGQPYYLPYLASVYLPAIFSQEDDNLEEALANVSILLSKKISRLSEEASIYPLGVLEDEFLLRQGPSYRNLSLTRGVPESIAAKAREHRYREVVNYLCNQIARKDLRPKEPLTPYYIYPPNNNFLRAEDLCPIYLVRNIPYQTSVIA